MRPTLYGSRHAVSAGHYLAAAAGHAILEAGGNAIDAGCCAGIALAVLHADEVNFAGVAPIMVRTAKGQIVTIAGLGHWPRRFPAGLFMEKYGGEMPFGILRTVVPAAPDAWITALRDYGTQTFGVVAAAAIRYAKEGFSVFKMLADEIAIHETDYRRWPSSAEVFLPNGRPPVEGERFIQKDLASLLQYMVDQERSEESKGRIAGLEAARSAFYSGDVAQRIVDFHRDEGGFLSRDDLSEFRSSYEVPVATRWRDQTLYTCGPWCQGPMLAQALTMLEKAGISHLDHNSVPYVHLISEVFKAAFSDREHHYGDPRHVVVDLDLLFSEKHIARRLAAIDLKRAMPGMPPGLYGDAAEYLVSHELPPHPGDTSYVCVIDRWGNAFSATPSDATWRGPVIPGLGIVISTRGSQSKPNPLHPAGVGPGRRPRLTPNPAISVCDNGGIMPFGAPEGDSQVQGMLQVFLNHFHFGMDVQEAIDKPRFVTYSFPGSFAPYIYHPGMLALESRFPAEVVSTLKSMGHHIRMLPEYSRRVASVEAIHYDPASGFLKAGADPRQPAYAIVS
jgi:gamma-glutamyltranspeptidase / glutathione hydrolase